MQKTLDSFFHKVQTVEETISREWKENPLPRSPATPKRPVGGPKKRNFEEVEEAILIREVEQTKDVSQTVRARRKKSWKKLNSAAFEQHPESGRSYRVPLLLGRKKLMLTLTAQRLVGR